MPPISLRYTPPYKLHLRKGKYYVSVVAPDEIKHFDAAYGFVRRHCENNPEKTIMTGVVAFTQEVTDSKN